MTTHGVTGSAGDSFVLDSGSPKRTYHNWGPGQPSGTAPTCTLRMSLAVSRHDSSGVFW